MLGTAAVMGGSLPPNRLLCRAAPAHRHGNRPTIDTATNSLSSTLSPNRLMRVSWSIINEEISNANRFNEERLHVRERCLPHITDFCKNQGDNFKESSC
jgi:hypothetical protein